MVPQLKKIASKLLGRSRDQDWRNLIPTPILQRLPRNKPLNLVDIGAHDGDFTRAISLEYTISRALLIEALPGKASKLRSNFLPPTYQVVECAASDSEGPVEFEMNSLEETSSLLKIRADLPELAGLDLANSKKLQVQARKLDTITEGFPEIDLLKIDVQGAELQVLAAAAATLARTQLVWIEVSFKPLYENSATFFDIYNALERAGFGLTGMQPAFRSPSGEILQADALFFKK